jgi:hypothetical protein
MNLNVEYLRRDDFLIYSVYINSGKITSEKKKLEDILWIETGSKALHSGLFSRTSGTVLLLF